jgi:hypothetical protein
MPFGGPVLPVPVPKIRRAILDTSVQAENSYKSCMPALMKETVPGAHGDGNGGCLEGI